MIPRRLPWCAMKHLFKVRYEIDCPLAVAVVTYLDCAHYVHLHKAHSDKIEVIERGKGAYRVNQVWHVLGFTVGQSYTCEYEAPSTFHNRDLLPYPRWAPSVHSLIKTRTTLKYFETDRRTTLSELTVELEMPAFLYPLRRLLERVITRVKILKDLEDVAMIDRRARLFGRDFNSDYLRKHEFLLHKAQYEKYFAEGSQYLGETPEEYRSLKWTDIKELPYSYVQRFLQKDYDKFC